MENYIYRKYSLSFNFVLLLLWMPCLLLGTNELDSLEQHLKLLSDGEEKVNLLNKLGHQNHQIDIRKTFDFAQQALELSEEINYSRGKVHAYNLLSIANIIGGDKNLSYQQLEKSIQLADSIEAYDLLVKAYNIKGGNLEKDGRLDEALIIYQKGLDLANRTNDDWGIAVIPVNLGGIHSRNENYTLARTYFRQSIKEAVRLQKIDLVSWGYRRLAKTYLNENNLTQATIYYDKALISAKQAQNDRSIAYLQSNLAEVYSKTNRYELAEQTALESIELFKKIGDKEGKWNATTSLLDIYLATKRPHKVINFVRTYQEINQDLYDIINHAEILEILVTAHVQQEEYKKAYDVGLRLKSLQDSLSLENKMNLAAELEEKYQLKNKEIENTVLKLEQQKQTAIIKQQQRFNYSLLVVAILSSLLAFTIYQAYSNKRKSNLLLEEKIAERTQALKKSNLELVQSNKELESFAFATSHDLREPLMNIISFTNLLQKKFDKTNDATTKQFMKFIQENTLRMNSLILDTLEFTRLSKDELQLEVVDLNKVIADIESSLASTLQQKKAVIKIVQTLPTLSSNDAMMFSLFKNLIENGIKYNEATTPTILINYQTGKDFYTFSITDNGIGIPAEFQEIIFEMFKRLQPRSEYQGSGLGLANCKKIVTKLGGKIWVESREDMGSTFYFTLNKKLTNSKEYSISKVPEVAMSV